VSLFTVQQIQPEYRSILDDMIRNSINLIKLEREQGSIELSTLRFSQWLSSVPPGQDKIPDFYDLPAVKAITAPIDRQLDYEHRRRAIDQGHKMIANINAVTAMQAGAIAAVWHAHPKTVSYDARPEHWARNEHLYVMRDSWAVKDGLLKKTNAMWLEDIQDPPTVPVNCTCFYSYQYSVTKVLKKYPEAGTPAGLKFINAE
jgi:hypothetical protein